MSSSTYPDLTGSSLVDLLSLHGRTAVITGGGRGIGLQIAHRLAEAGCNVVIGDIDTVAAESAATEVQKRWDVIARGLQLDVRDSASVDSFGLVADSVGSGLNIWVNNAGIYPATPLAETSDQEWGQVLDVTLTGAFYGARAAARLMMGRDFVAGRVIINVTSVAGIRGRANLASYVAAKHGVSGLVRSMAIELGSHGIRVLGIAPSLVDTPGTRKRREEANAQELGKLQEFEGRIVNSIPLGRAGVPDDVARLVLYCASDLSSYVSGVVIPVDGGLSAA